MSEALYEPDAGLFVPTPYTQGPWSVGAQHGGPAAALLAGSVEALPTAGPMQVARLTVELLRPVPLVPLRVEARTVRPGRRIQLEAASLLDDQLEVARAVALRIRTEEVALPDRAQLPTPPGPERGTIPRWSKLWPSGYHDTAVEMRVVKGDPTLLGPATAWIRLKVPVVAGEDPSPLQRAAAAADFGNGVSTVLDPDRFLYINPDLTVYLHRPPRGEWVCLEANTVANPTGIGLAESALFDQEGPIGRSLQSLLVGSRG